RGPLALDDGRLAAGASETTPARPEDHRQECADRSDDQQDDADRVEVEPVTGDMHRKRENRTDRDEYEADSDAHRPLLPYGGPTSRRLKIPLNQRGLRERCLRLHGYGGLRDRGGLRDTSRDRLENGIGSPWQGKGVIVLSRVDRAFGQRIEATVRNHHRRRLTRLGWGHVFDGQPGEWAKGGPPPRPGSYVEVLVDGAEALPAIAHAIASARLHVHL